MIERQRQTSFKLKTMLKWDARNKDKGKHDKFKNMLKGPFRIATYWGQNAFLVK